MNQSIDNISQEIKALPCFAKGQYKITPLAGGESHECFSVISTVNSIEMDYFVKSLADHKETAIAEIASNLLAAEAGLAPTIIYHSPMWLVCQFIAGDSLAHYCAENVTRLPINKIIIAMNLMAKTHQLKLPVNHPTLAIEPLMLSQTINKAITPSQMTVLNEIIVKITPSQSKSNRLVLCHGDVNDENIRLSDSFNPESPLDHTWLVDFECSCLAEAEYDIAMFIAINGLMLTDVDIAIQSYQQCADVVIDKEKVVAYLACCYLINGLWYIEATINSNQSQIFIAKARQQFVLFDQLALTQEKVVPLFNQLLAN
jgi:thiamine kinase-like enzyme